MSGTITVGYTLQNEAITLLSQMANRHGVIAGATGTGKTFTLKRLVEGLSALGVPTFVTDIKGDLSGMSQPGQTNPKLSERLTQINLTTFAFKGFPTTYWDVLAQQGIPVRTTVTELGPILLGQLLGLNATQQSVLAIVFKIADDQGLLLVDLKDLQALLQFVAENTQSFKAQYGHLAPASVGAITRELMALETQGAAQLFGEPALQLAHLMQTTPDGLGYVNLLAAQQLYQQPKLYAAFLIWLLSELFETLPEVGDLDKPKLVLFFDEAHLLFDELPEMVLDKLEQLFRLIRSKGVGVFLITQQISDIPETIQGQLSTRVQHALRIFSPKDTKNLRAIVEGFMPNPALDLGALIPQLGIGEAVVSTLNASGIPTLTQHVRVVPPQSLSGPLEDAVRQNLITASPFYAGYQQAVDRESAFEVLQKRLADEADEPSAESKAPSEKKSASRPRASEEAPLLEAFVKSALRTLGSQFAREITRGLLGSARRRRRY